MVPKNAYIITYYKEGASEESTAFVQEKHEYITDYKDVVPFIKKNLAHINNRFIVSKVVDVVTLEVGSAYDEVPGVRFVGTHKSINTKGGW